MNTHKILAPKSLSFLRYMYNMTPFSTPYIGFRQFQRPIYIYLKIQKRYSPDYQHLLSKVVYNIYFLCYRSSKPTFVLM